MCVSACVVCVCVCLCLYSVFVHVCVYICLTSVFFLSQQLKLTDPVLNYKDSSGDLVEMCDEEDIPLLLDQGTHPKKHQDSQHASWALYITKRNDFSVYNTGHFKQTR